MGRTQLIAYLTLAALALFVGFTVLSRFHDGRCHPGGRRGGLDCTSSAAGVPRP